MATTAKRNPIRNGTRGLGVDAYGGATVDPSLNTKDLAEALDKSQTLMRENDKGWLERLRAADSTWTERLRIEEQRYTKSTYEYLKSIFDQQSVHHRDMRLAESERINSVLALQAAEANRRNAEAQQNLTTLAAGTIALKDTTQKQAVDLAAQVEARATSRDADVNKRLGAVEAALSETKGKTGVTDPQTDRMAQAIEALALAQGKNTSKSEGISAAWSVMIAIVSIALTAGVLSFRNNLPPAAAPAPQIIIVPASAASAPSAAAQPSITTTTTK